MNNILRPKGRDTGSEQSRYGSCIFATISRSQFRSGGLIVAFKPKKASTCREVFELSGHRSLLPGRVESTTCGSSEGRSLVLPRREYGICGLFEVGVMLWREIICSVGARILLVCFGRKLLEYRVQPSLHI